MVHACPPTPRPAGRPLQAQFLRDLGVEVRLQQLLKKASPEQAQALQEGCRRLLDEGDNGMGKSYQVGWLGVEHAGA